MTGIVSPRMGQGGRPSHAATPEAVAVVSIAPNPAEQQPDQIEQELLGAIYDRSEGVLDRLVRPATLRVAGLTREEIHDGTQRLLDQGLLDAPHGAGEVCLTAKAAEALAGRSPKKSSKAQKGNGHAPGR